MPPRGPAFAAAAPLASDRGDRTLETDLDRRLGLPRALQAGLDGHPREGWRGAGHELASFWLDKHAHLDALSDDLRSMLATATARDAGDRAFAGAFAPRVQRFLGELDGHHRIEDGHYFPQLRRMEPSLAVGFDLLDADHEKIHEDIVALIDGANALLRILNGDAVVADHGRALARCAADSERMHRRLQRHLHDEEDLIIPLLLAQNGG